MSTMMLPPDPSVAPNVPIPPGGGGPPGPMDAVNQGPLPAGPGDGGLSALQAALGGGGGPPGPPDLGGGGNPTPDDVANMDPVQHIQEAMKHLMMALAKEPDEASGQGIVKGMGALQQLLAGDQKKNAQLQQLGG